LKGRHCPPPTGRPIMLAALALGEIHGDDRSRGRAHGHGGELRPAPAPGRDHPVLQAPADAPHAPDHHGARREGPAGATRAARSPAPERRGPEGRTGAGGAGNRAGDLPLRGQRPLVDRAHSRADGRGAPDRRGNREALEGLMSPAAASSDAELILAVLQRDDRAAFAELVVRHQSKVRTLLRRLARGDAALADDLAQETFVLAWRNLRAFRFEARFSTWLYRIAFNAWRSDARKRRE